MPNKPTTTKGAFQAGEVRQLLKAVEKFTKKIEGDFARYTQSEMDGLRDSVIAYGVANFTQLFNNFVQIEFINKRGLGSVQVPSVFRGIRDRYIVNWRQVISKGFATASDSARGLQQKIQSQLLGEIRRENQRLRLIAIQKGDGDSTPKPIGILGLLLRLFGIQRAQRKKTRRFNLGLIQYLMMLFRTMPRNMERDMMRFLIRFFEDNTFMVTGGKVDNSASTCIYADGRVFTQRALNFITRSSALKVHLFHPNCRHRIVPPPKNFKGKVIDLDGLPAVTNGHFQGFHK